MTHQEATPTSSALSPWQELEATCAAALGLSREVSQRLQQGVGAHEFVPLLRRELELADQLRKGIRGLAPQRGEAPEARCRQLVGHVRALLDAEQQNHQLLTRKGVRLSGPQLHGQRH